jgi:hypothetical protein
MMTIEESNRVINETNKPELVREQRLETALQSIAACATHCPCCEMHRNIAVKALGYDVEISTEVV